MRERTGPKGEVATLTLNATTQQTRSHGSRCCGLFFLGGVDPSMVRGLVLKTSGVKALEGSNPSASSNIGKDRIKVVQQIANLWPKGL